MGPLEGMRHLNGHGLRPTWSTKANEKKKNKSFHVVLMPANLPKNNDEMVVLVGDLILKEQFSVTNIFIFEIHRRILEIMRKLSALLFFVVAINASGQNAAITKLMETVALQPTNFEIGVGYATQHEEGFGIPRMTLAVNNVYSGLGFYLTPEYRSGITFIEDGTNYYFRMLTGIGFEYGSYGLFVGADLISFAGGKNLRKEFGVVYSNPSVMPVDIRLGFSSWVGPTIGVGYRFPMKGSTSTGE